MIKLLLLNTQIHTAVFAPISKLGLYYKFEPPSIQIVRTLLKTVVKGHDGSIWVGYNDPRDDIVLEFEKRVYNNIKTQHQDDIFDYAEVTSGYFRNTLNDFNIANNITRSYFGEWSLKNKVRTQENTVQQMMICFWNYTTSVNILNNERIPILERYI